MNDDARVSALLDALPYARRLGIVARLEGQTLVTSMAFAEALMGNPRLPALHGGAVGAFLEITAQMALRLARETHHAPATIGVTIEYLRPARNRATHARADIKRLGRRIANVHVEAWQDENRTPVALLQGRFLMPD